MHGRGEPSVCRTKEDRRAELTVTLSNQADIHCVFELSFKFSALRKRQSVKTMTLHRASRVDGMIPLSAYMRRIHCMQ
jgi:hypothetical protein